MQQWRRNYERSKLEAAPCPRDWEWGFVEVHEARDGLNPIRPFLFLLKQWDVLRRTLINLLFHQLCRPRECHYEAIGN